ncbi:MAG: adenylate kinase [Candidatus Angelobacter sp.]
MQRVVILGRGGAGKSTLAHQLGDITRLPIVELDKIFWRPGLLSTPRDEWILLQQKLVHEEKWIMDGDFGPYDAVEERLRAADTIVLLDFSLLRCAWRAFRRSRERADFWRWVLAWRRRSRPVLLRAIALHAPTARLYTLRGPRAVVRFIADATRDTRSSG